MTIVLVGNKCDLTEEREVTHDEGEALAKANGQLFMETSAKEDKNVLEVFQKSAEGITEKIEKGIIDILNDTHGVRSMNGEYNQVLNKKRSEEKSGMCC